MVQALLNTKIGIWPAEPIDASKPCKSQTRRVIKPQPEKDGRFWKWHTGMWNGNATPILAHGHGMYNRMPIKPGDILYVRETFTADRDGNYIYKSEPMFNYCSPGDFAWDWKPSIHMPRKAARLFLEVKSVRVERLQEITEADAKAEGSFLDRCECLPRKNDKTPLEKLFSQTQCVKLHGYEFKALWNSINAKRGYSWESNPWVFVYEFMRVENQRGRKQHE
jgi:hypothetical protein